MSTLSHRLRLLTGMLFAVPCPCCHRRLAPSEHYLCTSCLLRLPLRTPPADYFDNDLARLFYGQIPIGRATAFLRYERGNGSSEIVKEMKYNHRPDLARYMGQLCGEELASRGFFEGIDIIVPVPLTRWRRLKRGYNQSEQLALGLQTVTALPIARHALRRVHFSVSQTQLNVAERRENVATAFGIGNSRDISGRHVLLVDDVLTTGATILACCRELMRGGATTISILTLASRYDKMEHIETEEELPPFDL